MKKKRTYKVNFSIPDIQREQWCDFRIGMIEEQMTLNALATSQHH